MAERSGVEIDYCPQCRGVWLDRGELDKIIERNAKSAAPAYRKPPRERVSDSRDSYKQSKKKRMSSFLDDIFDF